MKVFIKNTATDGLQMTVKNSFSIDVEPSDIVKKLKMKIQKLVGACPNKQALTLFGIEPLEDDRTLSSYNIKENWDIYLMVHSPTSIKIKIVIKMVNGKKIPLVVNPDMSVKQLKTMVQDVEGIPTDQQRLLFGGRQFEDERSLGSYNISDGSIIDCVPRLRGS